MANIEHLLKHYKGNRVIRGLIQLVPLGIGAAVDVVLVQTLEKIKGERAHAFFDELAKGDFVVDEKLLQSENFLHCYTLTVRCALNSRRREKIRMFARLLGRACHTLDSSNTDEYENLLDILDDLNYQEIQALNILDGFSGKRRDGEQNDLQWTNTFWTEFENHICDKLNIPREEITDFMNRIVRTGCYEVFRGTYWDYTGGKGKLTPTYRRLKKFIQASVKNS